jgi:hypothetical protein
MLRGGVPYVDFADHKPPLVFAYYAAAQRLGDGMLPVRLVTSLVLLPLVAYCASAFVGHGRRGTWAGLLFLVWSAAYLGHDMLAVNCELQMLAPLALSVLALREEEAARTPSRILVAGLLLGVATLFKYQAAAWGPALAAGVLVAGRRDARPRVLGRLALLCLGSLVPPLLAWIVFTHLGAGEAFLYWNWTHNVAYALDPVSLAETGERAATVVLPFLVATAPLWLAAWSSRRRLDPYPATLIAALLVLVPRRAPRAAPLPPLPDPALLPVGGGRVSVGGGARAPPLDGTRARVRGLGRCPPRGLHGRERLSLLPARRRLP